MACGKITATVLLLGLASFSLRAEEPKGDREAPYMSARDHLPLNPKPQAMPLEQHYSMEPEAQLIDQEMQRRGYVERAFRRDLILTEDCPLILFFSPRYGAEAAPGQMDEVPESCRQRFREWRRTSEQMLQEPLISIEARQEIEYEESFDDTAQGQVRIDADGLAWLEEIEPEQELSQPVTYVQLDYRGARQEITSQTEFQTIKKTKKRRTSLLPQYSDMHSLARYRKSVGRSIASEFPILDAPNSDAPVSSDNVKSPTP